MISKGLFESLKSFFLFYSFDFYVLSYRESYWNHKDTPTETMTFMLDFSPMQTRQKVGQVKAYTSVLERPHNPFREAVKDTAGCKLQALVYDILPLEEGARKRCSECEQDADWNGAGLG